VAILVKAIGTREFLVYGCRVLYFQKTVKETGIKQPVNFIGAIIQMNHELPGNLVSQQNQGT
jgi:hypothetical protein